jgi:histidinol phosphatase-like PHP family hydrolase
MIDLHTHTLFSDGELLPSELARRARVKGYEVIGFSDHVDGTNMEEVIRSLLRLSRKASCYEGITILPGVEITHVPPVLIGELITAARSMGAWYVVVHGETLSEPVEPGTNRAAILGGADILAHPGLITEEEATLAVEKGVLLEISARKGHSLANGHVAGVALRAGASLVFDTDTHSPSDLVTAAEAERITLGAGLPAGAFRAMQANAWDLVRRAAKEKA